MSELISEKNASMATILVIDDDTELATVFCDLLELNGFKAMRAPTGQVGIQLARHHCPQLIVCEIGLADISGYDVLTNLRSHPTTVTIPVIMVTGHDDSDTFRRSMEHGADDYLSKPADLESFLRAVQTQVHKRQQLVTCLASASAHSTDKSLMSAVSWETIKDQLATIKQLPWSSLWVVQLSNYNVFQTGYGHVFSQLVLKSIGQQLCQWQETWDNPTLSINTLAYLGENRFVVVLSASHTPQESSVETVIANLKTELQQPMVINNHHLIPDIHIKAIKHSDLATIQTLETTVDRMTTPGPAIQQLSLAEQLRRAMQRDELQLYFQPQVDLISGQIIGAEALVRWILPDKFPVSPAQFIPIAEEHGLMLPLGEWILETALNQLAYWQKIRLSGISIAVNLSAYQLRSLNFIDRLMGLVKTAQVSPVMVDLELPEHLIMEDLSRAKYLLAELQNKGFSTAIDDFGSASLSHLQYLPVNILKLDKCFVRDLHNNKSNQVIVRAIMEMARGLNISTIASGVETARELSILKQLNCQSMQGYLFSPALTAQDFETLLLEASKGQPETSMKSETALQAASTPS